MGGSSGALEGGTPTLHPLDPWQVLQCFVLSRFVCLPCCCPITLAGKKNGAREWLWAPIYINICVCRHGRVLHKVGGVSLHR